MTDINKTINQSNLSDTTKKALHDLVDTNNAVTVDFTAEVSSSVAPVVRETRETYVAHFTSLSDAVEYENATLQSGREFLPVCALAVLDGENPTPEYWNWLVSQVETDC